MLIKLAKLSYNHRWKILGLWILALIVAIWLANTHSGSYATDFSLPGTESQQAFDVLKARFPSQAGAVGQVVFKADQGINNPSTKKTITDIIGQVAHMPHVATIDSPYTPAGSRQVSTDGKIAFANIQYDAEVGDITIADIKPMLDLGKSATKLGLDVEFAGQPVAQAEFQPPGGTELIGIGAAIIILLIAFGSVLAMSLPILTALFGIGIGISLILVIANWINVPNFTPQFAAMIGLGVGIDYSLFIITRYRRELARKVKPETAIAKAFGTAGRAVLFAGIIVVVSMLGILLMKFEFMEGLAIGGAITVFVTMLASLTLLPAMLGFVGNKIDKWRVPFLRHNMNQEGQGWWFRWSQLIQRHPWSTGLTALIILLVLAIPLASARLGLADAGSDPADLTTRKAHDILTAGFGPGFDGPLVAAAELNGQADMPVLTKLTRTLAHTPGVAAAIGPVPNSLTNPTAAVITVYPTSSPQDEATGILVKHIRRDVVPPALAGTDVKVYVDGLSGVEVDFSAANSSRLPILIGVIIAMAFLLLMVVFRSLTIAIKAAIMNLLSISAAIGVLVAVFQWGWLGSLVGIGKPGPIEAWAPMMLFTVLFGLSMDYEVFLLSRIREEYTKSQDNSLAVARGVATTGRVISAAAAIMIAVFLSFVLGFDSRQIKLLGLGLAGAIFIDATIVRLVLVPATMEILGKWNWYLPKWLKKILPDVAVDPELVKSQ